MKKLLLNISAFACLCSAGFGQQNPAQNLPSSMVVVFQTDPSKFSGFQVDGQPVAANQVPMEYPSVWPVVAGKHELLVSAAEAEDLKTPVDFPAQKPKLLMLELGPNKDASKASRFPKEIRLQTQPIDLDFPKPETKSKKVYAYVLGGQPMNVEVDFGRSAPQKVQLPSKKLVLLGEGSLAVSVGNQPVFGVSPGNPGAYVFALLPLPDGKIRSLPFEFVVEAPEPSPGATPPRPPAD